MSKKINIRLAALVAAPLLLLSVACGGSDNQNAEQDSANAADQSPKAAEPAVPALDEAGLKKALLADDEATGYQGAAQEQQPLTPKADKAECQPLADITAYGVDRTPKAQAFASRTFTGSQADTTGHIISLALLSYEGQDAAGTLEGVRSAIAACGGGFETSGNNGGQSINYTSVEEGEAQGDDMVAVKLVGEAQGAKIPMNFVVTRSGSTLVQFMNLNVSDPAGTPVPEKLVTAQLDKLAETAAE